jgi:hypothetical protein
MQHYPSFHNVVLASCLIGSTGGAALFARQHFNKDEDQTGGIPRQQAQARFLLWLGGWLFHLSLLLNVLVLTVLR